MSSQLVVLDDHANAAEPEPFAGPDHPMRLLTRAKATGEAWSSDESERIQSVFDGLAPEWSESHVDPTKAAPVVDAFERGGAPPDADWLEVGSGTGAGARILTERVRSLVCSDLSEQMLAHAPDIAPRVRADASVLPFGNDSFDAMLLINMLLFPAEVDRVLRPGGTLLWVNTLGDQTPIHLPAADVLDAMPGTWNGTTAKAGTGFWLTATK